MSTASQTYQTYFLLKLVKFLLTGFTALRRLAAHCILLRLCCDTLEYSLSYRLTYLGSWTVRCDLVMGVAKIFFFVASYSFCLSAFFQVYSRSQCPHCVVIV